MHFLGKFVIILLSVTPLSLFSNARHACVVYPKRINSNMNGTIERVRRIGWRTENELRSFALSRPLDLVSSLVLSSGLEGDYGRKNMIYGKGRESSALALLC